MLSSARVADPAFSRAGALDVRYPAAAGAGEEEHKLLQAAVLARVVETGECEDVGASVETRARTHSDVHAFGPR